jgi:hypothetical protein
MASIQQPGATVIQELRTTSPTVSTATLPACIIGPAYEVIDVLDSDGLLSSDAATELYEQAALAITQSSYPAPRGNAAELNVDETSVRGFLLENSILTELPRGDGAATGSAFLAASNVASRASMVSERGATGAATAWSIADGDTLILAIDNPVAADVSQDITVTIAAAAANATVAEVVAAINTAFGKTVAAVFTPSGDAVPLYVQILSTIWGAKSSITLRGGSAQAEFMWDADFRRVEGSGYRAQDDLDGDLVSPWIEFFRGEATLVAATGAWGANVGSVLGCGLGRFVEGQLVTDDHDVAYATPVSFTGGAPTVPLLASTSTRAGDQVFVDGVQLLSGEVLEVQANRFRIGVLNSALSTFDTDGDPTTRVYDVAEANVMIHSTPLAPRNVWFQAQGLQWGSVSPAPVAAVLTGTVPAVAAQVAEVQADTPMTDAFLAPFDFSGLTLVVGRTVNGVPQANETFTFPGGSSFAAADTAALAAAIDLGLSTDLVVTAFRDTSGAGRTWVHISTALTGADQAVNVVFASSTAAASLGFTADATHTGKDAEFASPATETGELITLPMVNLAVAGYLLNMTLTDSRGVHTQVCLAAGITAISTDATIAALAAELNLQTNQLAWDGDIRIGTFSGPATASGQLVFTSTESGATVSFAMTNPFLTSGWTLLGFYNGAPFELISTGALGYPTAGGDRLEVAITDSIGGPTTLQSAVYGGALADAEAVVQFLNADAGATIAGGSTRVTYFVSGTFVGARSLEDDAGVTQLDYSAAGSVNAAVLGFAAEVGAAGTGANDDDTGTGNLATTTLLWTIDGSSCSYSLTFTSNSIDDAIAAINLLVGATVATKNGTDQLVFTSPMGGVASTLTVTNSGAAPIFGLAATASGSGRPNPDFFLDLSGAANFGAQILRNALTGAPFCPASAQAYLQYKGLRLDVSALSTATEKLLTIDDTVALAAALSPLTDDNPLGLGMFLALLNSPTTSVSGIGVDAVSTALSEGTLEAYARSADVLEAKDVYTLVPLSANAQVHQLFATHVTAMSQPAQRGERIVFINPAVPTRAYAEVLATGDSNSTANPNELVLDVNPSAAVVAQGLNPAVLAADDGVFVEITVNNVFLRYNVSLVNGTLLTLRVTFAAGENDDGFYSTTALSATLTDVDYTLRARGDLLLITGTTLTDYAAIATAVSDAAVGYKNRRVFYVFPDSVSVTLSSGLTAVPAYFAAAAVAGMVGQLSPSQGFTNYPISGLARVTGSNDSFKPSQLDTIAGGGVYTLQQAVPGAPVTCRHQLSTDVTSVERRELSITKAVDYVAKFLRNSLRNFIGSFNITPAFLDQLSTVIQGQLAFLGPEGLGVVASATLNNVIQDEDSPDTILVDVTLEVLYPANYIRVTLVV